MHRETYSNMSAKQLGRLQLIHLDEAEGLEEFHIFRDGHLYITRLSECISLQARLIKLQPSRK
jgi:hypothetical protein